MNNERRKHPRYSFKGKIQLELSGTAMKGLECSDISLGGMCVILPEKINNNNHDRGTLTMIYTAEKQTIPFHASFVSLWNGPVSIGSKKTRIGIRFINIDPENFERLCQIIALQPQPDKNPLCTNDKPENYFRKKSPKKQETP